MVRADQVSGPLAALAVASSSAPQGFERVGEMLSYRRFEPRIEVMSTAPSRIEQEIRLFGLIIMVRGLAVNGQFEAGEDFSSSGKPRVDSPLKNAPVRGRDCHRRARKCDARQQEEQEHLHRD